MVRRYHRLKHVKDKLGMGSIRYPMVVRTCGEWSGEWGGEWGGE